ncbi:glycosyltransferase [Hymenobacter terricola]|uniref:glycosyltransferase n=1 Tax=Hymenobacter terricola TaxID=2819236 RepID=UPI001B31854D|nr:glycosyltransferase [Hymenobacter terricola]
MEQQNIIMLCQQDWDLKPGTNARNLAREFAKHNRVLYVNLPLDVSTLVAGFRRPEVRQRFRVLLGWAQGLTYVEPNVWLCTPGCLALSINLLTSPRLFAVFNKLNAWLLARSIRKAARTLGFGAPYLLQDGLIFPGTELKRLLKPRKFIYYLRDYMVTVPYFRRHGPRAEALLLQQADVVANSASLTDYARQANPHSHDIGQGCVLALYQAETPHEVPADLAAVPMPRIGYTGFLTTVRLDLGLLLMLARKRPDYHLVLVGPEDADFRQSALHGLPNVHFLGNKTPAQLPAYVQHFDVCINPQAVNDVTQGNYPLKIDEYLAMGRPVVATRTRTMEVFADYAYLAGNQYEWLAQLAQVLVAPDPERAARGVALAQSHTWAASVAKLYAAVRAVSQAPAARLVLAH